MGVTVPEALLARADKVIEWGSARLGPQQFRPLGDVGGDPPCLVAGEKVCRRATARLFLAIDAGERLPVVIADDEAGVGLLDGSGARARANARPEQLFVPRVHVVPDAGDGSAPCIIVAALAGVVHHAKPLPATSMAARAINKGAFIMRSRLLSPDHPRCRIPSCK